MRQPETFIDEYSRQLAIQNGGGTCEHCGAALGHRDICPLITGIDTAQGFYRPVRFTTIEQVKEAFQHSAVPDPLDEVATDAYDLRQLFMLDNQGHESNR